MTGLAAKLSALSDVHALALKRPRLEEPMQTGAIPYFGSITSLCPSEPSVICSVRGRVVGATFNVVRCVRKAADCRQFDRKPCLIRPIGAETITVRGDMALSTFDWESDAVDAAGEVVIMRQAGTLVWEKQAGEWRIIHEHLTVDR